MESDPKVLSIYCERKRAFIHIQENPQNTLSLERFSIIRSLRVRIMSESTNPKKGPAMRKIRKRSILILFPFGRDSCFDLMLRPSISYDFPIVNSFVKRRISIDRPENVFFFSEVKLPVV